MSGTDEMDQPPSKLVLEKAREFHEELGAPSVTTDTLVDALEGTLTESEVRRAIEGLERRGEIYAPRDRAWRVTDDTLR